MSLLKKTLATCSCMWFTLPLRLTLGLIFLGHGAQKLFGMFDGSGLSGTAQFFGEKLGMQPAMLWAFLAGSGEFFGGLLVLLGVLTRFGALNIAIVMAVAMLQVHWGGSLVPKFFMSGGGIEYTLALFGAAVALLISGGGALSVDACLTKCDDDKGKCCDGNDDKGKCCDGKKE